MKNKKYITILLNGMFILSVLLLLMDGLTLFEIKSQMIKSFSYLGIMVLTPLTLIWNLWVIKSRNRKIIYAILPTFTLLGILIIGPMKIATSSSAWKTQTVIYENGHLNYKNIEFQMQDMGAFGYNKRTVEVMYISDLFMVTQPVEENLNTKSEWIKVDREVNELELKFP